MHSSAWARNTAHSTHLHTRRTTICDYYSRDSCAPFYRMNRRSVVVFSRHSKRFQMTYVVGQIAIAPNRFCEVSIFRHCHSTHLYVHKPHNHLAFFSITFQDFVHEYFFVLFKSMYLTTDSTIDGVTF